MAEKKVTINFSQKHYNSLNELVKNGDYNNFSEVVRDAIRKFLESKEDNG